MKSALQAVYDVAKSGGKILFIGTKAQSTSIIKDAAKSCGQHYVNHRWLGGMLTNWKTVSASIKRLEEKEKLIANAQESCLLPHELRLVEKQCNKLCRNLDGIRSMRGLPQIIFVLDTCIDAIAISEAKCCDIPVIAIIDSNSSTKNVSFPVPGNDDAVSSISLYCRLISSAFMNGVSHAKKPGNSNEVRTILSQDKKVFNSRKHRAKNTFNNNSSVKSDSTHSNVNNGKANNSVQGSNVVNNST